MEQIGFLVLGWLFGLLSPNVVDHIRRPYVRRELIGSILAELDEMRYTMASVAYAVKDHLFESSDEFLDWLLPVVRAYEGPRSSLQLAPTIEQLRAVGESARLAMLRARAVPGRGLGLKEYGLPFTNAKASDMRICSLDFQRAVFSISGKVDMFNQQVRYLQRQAELTFDASLDEPNRSAVQDNLDRGARMLGNAAITIVNDISQLTHDSTKHAG